MRWTTVWWTSVIVTTTQVQCTLNTPSVGKPPKNKGPDSPGFEQTDRTVATSSSHLHHDIMTRSRILASRVKTCEGMHCLAECSASAVRACVGRVCGASHAPERAFCSHFSAREVALTGAWAPHVTHSFSKRCLVPELCLPQHSVYPYKLSLRPLIECLCEVSHPMQKSYPGRQSRQCLMAWSPGAGSAGWSHGPRALCPCQGQGQGQCIYMGTHQLFPAFVLTHTICPSPMILVPVGHTMLPGWLG
eukprot:COSAG06_NODE_54_length_27948_cov_234.398671_18_plen_247_part_00